MQKRRKQYDLEERTLRYARDVRAFARAFPKSLVVLDTPDGSEQGVKYVMSKRLYVHPVVIFSFFFYALFGCAHTRALRIAPTLLPPDGYVGEVWRIDNSSFIWS